MSDLQNRRMFLRAAAAASAAWVAVDLIQVEDALAWTAQHATHTKAGPRPRPATAVNISATTIATTARPIASRMPVAMNGSEAGITILVKIWS